MTRYVMASRRAGKFSMSEKVSSRMAAAATLGSFGFAQNVHVTSLEDPASREIAIFDADPLEIENSRMQLPADVILEPEILHYPATFGRCSVPPIDLVVSHFQTATTNMAVNFAPAISLTVTSRGNPLEGASVTLFARGSGGGHRQYLAVTDWAGKVIFDQIDLGFAAAAAVAVPAGGQWTMVERGPTDGAMIECPPLPDPSPLFWWHEQLGLSKYDEDRGSGIRVGVIDTGFGPNRYLSHVNSAGAFIDTLRYPPSSVSDDVENHGSHVTGIIGTRPNYLGQPCGIAPGSDIYHARVFEAGKGANQGDIAAAIDALSQEYKCHLINMSLTAPIASEVLRDAIVDAFERGTVCVCAAGNDAGSVQFPAAFPEVIAVAALGLEGASPSGSLSGHRLPIVRERFGDGQLYLGDFSCFGPEIACAAPGVGIISTVPEGKVGQTTPYLAMDGTSMAAPVVCGALAVILAEDLAYRGLPRDTTKARAAKSLLNRRCQDIGLDVKYQGRGLPLIPNAVP